MNIIYWWTIIGFLGSITSTTCKSLDDYDFFSSSSSDSDSSDSETDLDDFTDSEDSDDFADFDLTNVEPNEDKGELDDDEDTSLGDDFSLDIVMPKSTNGRKNVKDKTHSKRKSKKYNKTKKHHKDEKHNKTGEKKHKHSKSTLKNNVKQPQLNEAHDIKPIIHNDFDTKSELEHIDSFSKDEDKKFNFHEESKEHNTGFANVSHNVQHTKVNDTEIENKVYKKLVADLNKNTDLDIAGISESIRYLGSGYDIIFGNPIGDPLMMVDPGYRNPIIKLEWDKHSVFNYNNSLPQPVDGWVRPEISCKQAEKVDHVNSLDDYKKELSVDAVASADFLNFFAFSGSGGYKNFAKLMTQDKTRIFILKTYCLRYIAGLETSVKLKLTTAFKNAVEKLPTVFDGFDENTTCPIDKFRANENDLDCATNIRPWIDFFKEFGTHFTSVVHLGGKMTYQVQMKQTDINKLQEQGINVDAAIKSTCGFGMPSISGKFTSKHDEHDIKKFSEYKMEKMILVIGGEPPKDLNDSSNLNNWAKSVAKSPMPIKSEIIPLRELFDSFELRQSYNQAIKYYSEVYGISQDDMYEIKGKIKGIPQIIKEAEQVTYSGPAPGRVVCPIGTSILFGFSMTITKKKKPLDTNKNVFYDVNIAPCVVGNEKCSGTAQKDAQVRIWVLCSQDPAPLLVQVSSHQVKGPASVECPKGFSIGMGFGITIPKGLHVMPQDIYSCRNGQTSCTKIPDRNGSTAVWAVCFENGALEASNLVNNAKAGASPNCESQESISTGLVNSCPNNYQVLCGFSMAFVGKNSRENDVFKPCQGLSSCHIDKHNKHDDKCVAYASWNVCGLVDGKHKEN